MKIFERFRMSQILTFGSFLLLLGVLIISYGHLEVLREEVFEQVRLSLLGNGDNSDIEEVTDANLVSNIDSSNEVSSNSNSSSLYKSRYIGYLEIPKLKFKRGFLSKEDKYNNIEYNVTVSEMAQYPDVKNGNFILMAHSGDAYISFFAYLYKLEIGDLAYVTYNNVKYKYKLVKIEEQPKTGVVAIHRPNYDVNGLTLITCTKDSDSSQSIYIFELV